MLGLAAVRNTLDRFLFGLGLAVSVASSACGVASPNDPIATKVPAHEVAEPEVDAEEAEAEVQAGAPKLDLANLPGRTDGCPDGMVRVEGEFCPAVIQQCLEHHPEWVKNQGQPGVAERCLRYAESKCLSKEKVKLSYCMDRFEYPNVPGQMPQVLTSWEQAEQACEAQGKRLCSEPEFDFACEGPEMLPYAYGYDRDADVCNQDKEYIFPDHSHRMLHYEECLKDERCAAELKRLDQREPIGSRAQCVSWAGVYDLIGNANEWVVRPGQKAPERSGLKGGWWGPIRSRCRPVTTFHKEDDYGYEVGFRCCADAKR